MARRISSSPARAPELTPEGLRLGDEVLPLIAASVHYWRLEPSAWQPALAAVRELGFRIVDVYVPWAVHELAEAEFDFGRRNPRLDLKRFLELAEELGMYAIVRPGPHINAELTCFGIPERVVWDEECQARSPRGKPVILPVPPLAFPVPSYASEAFFGEVAEWFAAFSEQIVPLIYPSGPVVLVQIDNEGALYFRDGVYDQDYHPDALKGFRRFLQRKYRRVEALRDAYGDPAVTFAKCEAPVSFNATLAVELAPHLDWAEFQEQMLADAFGRFRDTLRDAGLGSLPTSHNLPLSEGATPLDPERIGQVVDLLGLDYYHGASPPQRSEIARRTSELATRCAARGHPAFACELGAGFPPFFPPLTPDDNAFTALTALAYGLRGFNLYMAVERDRWIGAPIDPRGRRRSTADFWERLLRALERLNFHELKRTAPVQIVVPRSYRRLARVLHAFGPLSAAAFQVMGGGPNVACFEDKLGFDEPVVIAVAEFIADVERQLDRLRIPYAFVGGDLLGQDVGSGEPQLCVVACTGGLEGQLLSRVLELRQTGQKVILGPFAATRSDAMAPLDVVPALEPIDGVPAVVRNAAQVVELLERELAETQHFYVTPDAVHVTLHSKKDGTPAVLFVMNPSSDDLEASVGGIAAARVVDALDGSSVPVNQSLITLRLPKKSARMLELLQTS